MRWATPCAWALVALWLAGCAGPSSAPDAAPTGTPTPAPVLLHAECPDCRLRYEGIGNSYTHQVAADPEQPGRAAAALLHTPPVDQADPTPTAPVFLNSASIAVTQDDGRTWQNSPLPAGPGEGTPAYAAVAWAPGGVLWATAMLTTLPDADTAATGASLGVAGPLRVYRSTDSGGSWQSITTFDDGGGYGNVAVVDGTVYVSWTSDSGAHVAWRAVAQEGAGWQMAHDPQDCFSLSKVVATSAGLMATCTYLSGFGSPLVAFALDTAAATLTPVGGRSDCSPNGPALSPNGTLVVATMCEGLDFRELRDGEWRRVGSIDLEDLVAQSPLVRADDGTLHILVEQAVPGDTRPTPATQTVHAWLAPDGTTGSELLASSTDLAAAGASVEPRASPSLDGGAEGLWALAQADGILATRLVS